MRGIPTDVNKNTKSILDRFFKFCAKESLPYPEDATGLEELIHTVEFYKYDSPESYERYSNVIDLALRKFGLTTNPMCEYNHGEMRSRNGRYGEFYYCRCSGCSSTRSVFDKEKSFNLLSKYREQMS